MTINYEKRTWAGKKVILGKTNIQPNSPINLLIGLHGASSTPENMLIHSNHLNPKNTFLAFPEGPINVGEGCFSWWEDGPKQKETIGAYLTYTNQLIEQGQTQIKKEYPELPLKVSLWGFSQGAAATLVYSLLGSHPIYKAASICGFLPDIPSYQKEKETRASILGIFGTNDDIIPPFLAEHALEEMKNNNHNIDIRKTPQKHELIAENLKDINDFFFKTKEI